MKGAHYILYRLANRQEPLLPPYLSESAKHRRTQSVELGYLVSLILFEKIYYSIILTSLDMEGQILEWNLGVFGVELRGVELRGL